MKRDSDYPEAADPSLVGTYPARVFAGGGYVWDEVLEYRVWCHPAAGGSDYFRAFATYGAALAFSRETAGAEAPLALIRQDEYIDEPEPGRYVHVQKLRITEWRVTFLNGPRRTSRTIPDFLATDGPPNRRDIPGGLTE